LGHHEYSFFEIDGKELGMQMDEPVVINGKQYDVAESPNCWLIEKQ